jgi:hypothetical protein
MKIYTSSYRDHWVSPYTVLEKVLWWKDWENIEYDTPWVERWADRLSPVCKGVHKILDFIHPKIDYIKIDRWDTWSMDSTLAQIVLPMLVQLQATKHGSPYIADEDVPEHFGIRSTQAPPKENEWDIDSNHHLRWEYVLDEMIWAFKQLQPDCDWEALYVSGNPDYKFVKTDGDAYEMVRGPQDTYKINREGMEIHQQRIDKGLMFFGKYFQALWD